MVGTRGLRPLLAAGAAAGWAAPAFGHAGRPPAPHDLWTTWTFDPLVVVPFLLVALVYGRGIARLLGRAGTGRGRLARQAWAFAAGMACVALALVSPVDGMGAALFSAHMAQHLILMNLAAPLLVLGAPAPALLTGLPAAWRGAVLSGTQDPRWRAAWRRLRHPAVATALQMAILWVWHAPALYQATLVDEATHIAMHASMLAAAVLFWWSIASVGREWRNGPLVAAFAMLVTLKLSGMLGAIISFAPVPLYPAYAPLTAAWGLTPLQDQELSGLIMWVVAGAVYIVTCLALVAAWLRALEARSAGSAAVRPPA